MSLRRKSFRALLLGFQGGGHLREAGVGSQLGQAPVASGEAVQGDSEDALDGRGIGHPPSDVVRELLGRHDDRIRDSETEGRDHVRGDLGMRAGA